MALELVGAETASLGELVAGTDMGLIDTPNSDYLAGMAATNSALKNYLQQLRGHYSI